MVHIEDFKNPGRDIEKLNINWYNKYMKTIILILFCLLTISSCSSLAQCEDDRDYTNPAYPYCRNILVIPIPPIYNDMCKDTLI